MTDVNPGAGQWADLKAWAESLPPEYETGKRKVLDSIAAWNRRASSPVAPAGSDGEITDAMIEAGRRALQEHTDVYFDGSTVVQNTAVSAIWSAMIEASK